MINLHVAQGDALNEKKGSAWNFFPECKCANHIDPHGLTGSGNQEI